MENETAIEKSIKDFVFFKIQEQVYLDVSKKGAISIKHRSKHGSTALAMFWLRVLRHQNNYPMPKYPYKDLYDRQGNNKVILKVDNVAITTYMSTGVLMIQGVFVLEWFLNTFQTILDAYDAPLREPKPQSTIYRQYTENWKKLEDYYKAKKEKEDAEERAREEIALSVVDDRQNIISRVRKSEEADPDNEIGDPDDMGGDGPLSARLQQAADVITEELTENLELSALDVWPAETVQQQLEKLQSCCVRDGPAYIYPLWKSLLHHWFSDPCRKVYIVTPFLDARRLIDVCQTILDHRITANLDSFYVRQSCGHQQKVFEVKQMALSTFDAKDQMFLEYKIYSNIIYPVKSFHATFLASIKGTEAEVFVTSASFHEDHFELDSLDTVQYQKMSEADFIRGFLCPLNASVLVKK